MQWLSCVNVGVIAIITIKNVDYRCITHNISKSKAKNLLENSVLKNGGYIYIYIYIINIYIYIINIVLIFNLFKTFFYFFCLVYIKWLIVWTSMSH